MFRFPAVIWLIFIDIITEKPKAILEWSLKQRIVSKIVWGKKALFLQEDCLHFNNLSVLENLNTLLEALEYELVSYTPKIPEAAIKIMK